MLQLLYCQIWSLQSPSDFTLDYILKKKTNSLKVPCFGKDEILQVFACHVLPHLMWVYSSSIKINSEFINLHDM